MMMSTAQLARLEARLETLALVALERPFGDEHTEEVVPATVVDDFRGFAPEDLVTQPFVRPDAPYERIELWIG